MKFEVRRADTRANDPPAVAPKVIDDGAPAAAPAPPSADLGMGDPRALLPWLDTIVPQVLPPAQPMMPGDPLPAPRLPPAVPLANPDDLKARADRLQAEALLESKRLEAGEDASKGVDILLDLPAGEQTKAVDQLDDTAFENMLERVPDAEREKMMGLVEAAHDPRRRLRIWSMIHKTRAALDFEHRETEAKREGDEEDNDQLDRRREGCASDRDEVNAETQGLLFKPDLTIAEVDALRARKDRELAVEMKYNINLVAQDKPGFAGEHVQWSVDDLEHVDLVPGHRGFDRLERR